MSQDVSLKMTELDRLTSLPHMQLVKAALPYIHIPEQRFFSLFVKFRELEKTMQLFADPADGEIGICSVGERDKDSPVDMLKAIKPYGTEEEQSSIDLVLNFIEGSRLYESYWQNTPQTASFPTSQDIQNDSPNSDAVPASVLYPQAEYSRRQKKTTDRASGTSTSNRQEAHTMEFQNWKQDPRLRSMDPDKIKQMEQLADQARNTPQDKLLPLLMSLRGSNGSPQFSTSEMDTLFSILTDQMPPAQKRQAEMLRMLSRQMGGANKS